MSAIQLDNSRLESLLESARMLHSSLDLDDLLRHLLRTVMGRLLVGRGLIAIEEDGAMRLALARGLKNFQIGEVYDEAAARAAGVRHFFPLGDAEQTFGVLGVAATPGTADGAIDPAEEESIRALLSIAASGIANARAHAESHRLNQDLEQKIQELRALLDLVRGLSATLEPEAIATLLMLTLAGRWAVRKYALVTYKEGHPTVLRQKGMSLPDLKAYHAELDALPEAIAVEALPAGPLKELLAAQQGALVFPIRSSEYAGGAIVLGARPGGLKYGEGDLEFGAGLVAQAGVAFENAWHVRETLDKKRMEQELELAAGIQERLFPETLPRIAGYDIAARNRPARHCGGDYYDALMIEDAGGDAPVSPRCLLCVADVSGKGLPASLLMSNMQATLRALAGRVRSLTELAARINELLYAASPSNKFVTAIVLELDPATGAGRYVNAGHNECVLLRRGGEVELLKSTGLPLGMLPGMPYQELSVQIEPGDVLALYSDGVPEAYDEAENEWGDARLIQCLRDAGETTTATQVADTMIADIDKFAGLAPQHDDITLMILRRDG